MYQHLAPIKMTKTVCGASCFKKKVFFIMSQFRASCFKLWINGFKVSCDSQLGLHVLQFQMAEEG